MKKLLIQSSPIKVPPRKLVGKWDKPKCSCIDGSGKYLTTKGTECIICGDKFIHTKNGFRKLKIK